MKRCSFGITALVLAPLDDRLENRAEVALSRQAVSTTGGFPRLGVTGEPEGGRDLNLLYSF